MTESAALDLLPGELALLGELAGIDLANFPVGELPEERPDVVALQRDGLVEAADDGAWVVVEPVRVALEVLGAPSTRIRLTLERSTGPETFLVALRDGMAVELGVVDDGFRLTVADDASALARLLDVAAPVDSVDAGPPVLAVDDAYGVLADVASGVVLEVLTLTEEGIEGTEAAWLRTEDGRLWAVEVDGEEVDEASPAILLEPATRAEVAAALRA